MRILIVTRNLPPLVGGMERLNWHMAEELSKFAEVRVVGPAGAAALAPNGVRVREAPLKPLWKFLLRARTLARHEARTWRPDVVLAGSGLTAPIARSVARACGARYAVYVHGLDVAVRNIVYRTLWLPSIRQADRVIANSRATEVLCRGIGVNPAYTGIVHPGVDPPPMPVPLNPHSRAKGEETLHLSELRGSPRNGGGAPIRVGTNSRPAVQSFAAFRSRHNLGSRPLLLSVGRLSARKGLREFVMLALPLIVAAHPDVTLLIVGGAPKDALHAEAQTPDAIRLAAEQAGVADNLKFLGKISDDELEAAYCTASVHVFPVREIPGDPEGFGMVAVEAAARGLPTVAFASGGVVDAVAEGQSGYLITPRDYAAFGDAVINLLGADSRLGESCVAFACQFVWPEFGRRLVYELEPR